MKVVGMILVAVGLIWAVVAFNMQTTVTSPSQRFGSGDYTIETPSVTVNNIGLMDRRRNNLLFAGLTILVGVVFIGFGSLVKTAPEGTDSVACPYCAELVKPGAVVCKHCGKNIGVALAEREQLAAKAKSEVVKKQQAAFAEANRQNALQLCNILRERELNFDQYQQLALAAGASLALLTGTIFSPYVVRRDEDEIVFKRFKALRPWFLANIVPKLEGDA